MKKISLAIIAAALFAAPANAESNFDGFRVTLSGSVNTSFGSPTLTIPGTFPGKGIVAAVPANPGAVPPVTGNGAVTGATVVALGNSFGKVALDLGYAKVLSSNFLVGASVFGGWDFMNIDKSVGTEVVVPTDPIKTTNPTQLADDQNFKGGFFGGLKLQAGMVVTPKIAISLIGDVNLEQYNFAYKATAAGATTATSNTIYSDWTMGGSVGAKVEFAAADRVILGLGAKYQIAPTDINFKQDSNKDATNLTKDEKFSFGGNSWVVFAEATYRITTN